MNLKLHFSFKSFFSLSLLPVWALVALTSRNSRRVIYVNQIFSTSSLRYMIAPVNRLKSNVRHLLVLSRRTQNRMRQKQIMAYNIGCSCSMRMVSNVTVLNFYKSYNTSYKYFELYIILLY